MYRVISFASRAANISTEDLAKSYAICNTGQSTDVLASWQQKYPKAMNVCTFVLGMNTTCTDCGDHEIEQHSDFSHECQKQAASVTTFDEYMTRKTRLFMGNSANLKKWSNRLNNVFQNVPNLIPHMPTLKQDHPRPFRHMILCCRLVHQCCSERKRTFIWTAFGASLSNQRSTFTIFNNLLQHN